MSLWQRLAKLMRMEWKQVTSPPSNAIKDLEDAIRDMEDALSQGQRALVDSVTAVKRLEKERERCEAEIAEWERRAKLAIELDDDDAARNALREKRALMQTIDALNQQASLEHQRTETLRRTLLALQKKIQDAKALRRALIAKQTAYHERKPTIPTMRQHQIDASAFAEYERLVERLEEEEARASAELELEQQLQRRVQEEATVAQFEEMEIERELTHLKSQVKPKPKVAKPEPACTKSESE